MKITYDSGADASYVYFTKIGPGGVVDMLVNVPLDVDLDERGQIVSMRLLESGELKLQDRLTFVLQNANTAFDESTRILQLSFAKVGSASTTINWDGNLDLDGGGQILGLEILFSGPEYTPDDGVQRLYAAGRLEHLSRFFVPFDESF